MEERMSIKQKFLSGYVPYTAAPLLLLLLLVPLLAGPAAIPALFALISLTACLLLFQLVILWIPAKPENRSAFHAGCVAITFLNLFFTPLMIASLIWIVRGILGLAT